MIHNASKLESLSQFRTRTEGFIFDSLPRSGGLETNPNLSMKVGSDGGMKPFGGNTVVFPLPEEAAQAAARIQDRLYQLCTPVLAEPLAPSSFHITLHDLFSGKPDQALRNRIDSIRDSAVAQVLQMAEAGGSVRLYSTALFNLVNTSMVLGFAPADEDSCQRLMAWYEIFQALVPLKYPLTPHVTIAYFRPGTISVEQVDKLRQVVDKAGQQPRILLELPAAAIEHQLFSDMNHYFKDM